MSVIYAQLFGNFLSVSGVSSLSSSSNSSTRSSPAKESLSSPTSHHHHQKLSKSAVNCKQTAEPTQDTIRKAFEAQLIAGKNKLKKIEDEVGQVAKPPPAPVPPPPPPPMLPTEGGHAPQRPAQEHVQHQYGVSGSLRSYEIPQAPKLKKTPPAFASKKGLVAPNGLSAREELMMAIRGTGGFQGLRKVNTKRKQIAKWRRFSILFTFLYLQINSGKNL